MQIMQKKLLDLANENTIHGIRLMPLLKKIMMTANDHGIDERQEHEILSTIDTLTEKCGFELIDVWDGLVKVEFCDHLCNESNSLSA